MMGRIVPYYTALVVLTMCYEIHFSISAMLAALLTRLDDFAILISSSRPNINPITKCAQ